MYYVGASAVLLIFDPSDPNGLQVPEFWIAKIRHEVRDTSIFALAAGMLM